MNGLVGRQRLLFGLAFVFFVVAHHAPVLAQSDEVEKKVREEVSRRVSDAVSGRIGQQIISDVAEGEALSNSAWFTPSYSNVSEDDGGTLDDLGVDLDADIFNFVFGGDHRFGDSIFVGLSGSYARADAEVDLDGAFDVEANSDTFAITPYAAYRFHEFLFASALVGYSYSDGDVEIEGADDVDSDTSTINTELAMNAVGPVGDFVLKGKVGWRFAYSKQHDIEGDVDDDSDTHGIVVSAEGGYPIDRITPYLGAQYEHLFPEGVKDSEFDQDFVYLTAGARARVTDVFTAGASFRAEVANQETNDLGGALELQLRF